MLAFFTTDMHWVVALRKPTLTSFFKIFLFFASDLFYLTVVSIGYWGWNRSLFKELGVLVCVCTLLNVALKQVLDLPRPSIEHLVETLGTGGFPSGDVQVAMAFWMFLILSLKKQDLWYLATIFVTFIGLSRLYLGVHSPLDLLGGLVIGLLYTKGHIRIAHSSWWARLQERPVLYVFGIVFAYCLYFYIVPIQKYKASISAGGCLLGVILATWLAKKSPIPCPPTNRSGKFIAVGGGIVSTLILRYCFKWLPAPSLVPYIQSLAFAFLALYIFFIWPKAIQEVHKEKSFRPAG